MFICPNNQDGSISGPKLLEGGQTIQAEAPLDKIPLFIKSGSIVPMGKAVQHSNQNSNKELDIYIFEGNNGELTLYEDEATTTTPKMPFQP